MSGHLDRCPDRVGKYAAQGFADRDGLALLNRTDRGQNPFKGLFCAQLFGQAIAGCGLVRWVHMLLRHYNGWLPALR